MNKAYVITESCDNGDKTFLGVFSTAEKAKSKLAEWWNEDIDAILSYEDCRVEITEVKFDEVARIEI